MKITLRSIAAYLFGIPIALFGLPATLVSVPAGLMILTGGLLALPVIRRQLSDRTGIEFSGGAAAGIFLVCAVAGVTTLALSADGGSSGPAGPGADVSNVSVTPESTVPDAASYQLSVEWNSRAQSAVDPNPDDMSIYNTEDGEKFLVVRMHITNTGSQDIELTPRFFKFKSEGVIYDYQALFGSGHGLSGVTLTPGADYTGWLVFAVPSDTSSGTLLVNQDTYYDATVETQFEHDTGMAINMSA